MIKNIQLCDIYTQPQLRTRNGFDAESIAQLAASIQLQGLLQPLVVAAEEGGYRLIAGHRRLAALHLNGQLSTDANVLNVEVAAMPELQLAENIQREALTLGDTADAVRALLAIHKTPKIVGRIVNKSGAWVSKHLALTKPGFSHAVHGLLESGLCDDLEILLALDKMGRHAHPLALVHQTEMLERVANGNAGRQDVRDALALLDVDTAGDDDAEGEGEGESEGGGETDSGEVFGKLELAESSARKMLAALEYAQKHKPSSRPGIEVIGHLAGFIETTWGA